MAADADQSAALAAAVAEAARRKQPLNLQGSASKTFYGRAAVGEPLSLTGHCGIIDYAPSELILTARAGTPLAEIEAALVEHDQMLPFEPPHFDGGTLGGAVAAGIAGPRRPFAGAVRDMILGIRLINGHGEILRFGGAVMKNVAGYDLSRLNTGALGTLGIILEVSVKVLPRAQTENSLTLALPPQELHGWVERWRRAGAPVSAAIHDGEIACVRLSGTTSGVQQGSAEIGGEALADADAYWARWRDHAHPFFRNQEMPLWRIALPPGRWPAGLPGRPAVDWAGQQIWLFSDAPAAAIREPVTAVGGHATLFAGGDRHGAVFQPLPAPLMRLHQRVKHAFDPVGILNPGRMYPE